MSCTSGCSFPGTHETYGACLRAKTVKVAYCDSVNGRDATRQKKWQGEIDAYRSATAQGMDPDGSTMPKIRAAEKWSQQNGVAYSPAQAQTTRLEKVFGKS